MSGQTKFCPKTNALVYREVVLGQSFVCPDILFTPVSKTKIYNFTIGYIDFDAFELEKASSKNISDTQTLG